MGKKRKMTILEILIIFLLIMILMFECIYVGGPCLSIIIIIAQILHSFKITKQEIADYYGITRKTLCKWLQFIPNSFNFEKYKEARKLTWLDFVYITIDFGRKEEQYPLTKGALKAMCETRYETMRNCISLQQCGISKETYKKIDIFPPNISRNLSNHFGC